MFCRRGSFVRTTNNTYSKKSGHYFLMWIKLEEDLFSSVNLSEGKLLQVKLPSSIPTWRSLVGMVEYIPRISRIFFTLIRFCPIYIPISVEHNVLGFGSKPIWVHVSLFLCYLKWYFYSYGEKSALPCSESKLCA